MYNTKHPLSDSMSGRGIDTNAYRPITSNRQVNESSRRSAGSMSAVRTQSARKKKKIKKSTKVSSTHSLQLAVPNQYNAAQQEQGEKDSDKQTHHLDDLSQSRSIHGIDEKMDGSP